MKGDLAKKRPFRAISPGEILDEEIKSRGWSDASRASKLGLDQETVGGIIDGTGRITALVAQALSHALGTSRQYWLNLEKAYRQDLRSAAPGSASKE